jgi:hypothetical protein
MDEYQQTPGSKGLDAFLGFIGSLIINGIIAGFWISDHPGRVALILAIEIVAASLLLLTNKRKYIFVGILSTLLFPFLLFGVVGLFSKGGFTNMLIMTKSSGTSSRRMPGIRSVLARGNFYRGGRR